MLGNRNSQHTFAVQPSVNMPRSQFNRSFAVKDTMDFDYLNPIFVEEILPGDTCNLRVNSFMRLATQKVPIMDNLMVDFFFFFVPNRLVWENWEKLQGAQENPGDSTDYICPQMTFPAGGPEVGTIFDKYGLPTDITAGYKIKNTLALRAYPLIWNEWFRDQNLQDSIDVPKDDGPDVPSDFTLLKRGKVRDFFTSCLPWPQKGPAVELYLGTTAPVIFNVASNSAATLVNSSTHALLPSTPVSTSAGGFFQNSGGITAAINPLDTLLTDLSSATAANINQLREAFAMQSLFELDARGGTRYVESLLSRFNVQSPDFRLQRPEYLGGGSQTINSHPVAQTAPTTGTDAQGQLAAFATSSSAGSSIGFTKSFVEHGYVIGLACARASVTYQQGVNRLFNRSTRFDFFEPKLSDLGEQAVLQKEIYVAGTSADETVFGYQEHWAEYRYRPSEIHGEFRSTFAQSLDFWHMAEEFGTSPALNATFIQMATPIERAIAVPSAPHLLVDLWFDYKHARPLPTYSVPAQLGRF